MRHFSHRTLGGLHIFSQLQLPHKTFGRTKHKDLNEHSTQTHKLHIEMTFDSCVSTLLLPPFVLPTLTLLHSPISLLFVVVYAENNVSGDE